MSFKVLELQKNSVVQASDIDKINLAGDVTTSVSLDGKTATLTFVSGLTNAFTSITDGVNTTFAVGSEAIKFISANNLLSISIVDNAPTLGDYVSFVVNENNISHTQISNIGINSHTQIDSFITAEQQLELDTLSPGVISGGLISNTTGNVIDVTAGTGYVNTGTTYIKISWAAQSVATIADGTNHISIDSSGTAQSTTTMIANNIYLGHAYIGGGNVYVIDMESVPKAIDGFTGRVHHFVSSGIGPIVLSGTIVSEQASPNFLQLNISSGVISDRLQDYNVPASTTFTKMYHSSDLDWAANAVAPNTVDVSYWNNYNNLSAAALVPMTVGFWKKDLIIRMPGGSIYYIYGQAEHSTYESAHEGSLPVLPASVLMDAVILAIILVKQGSTTVSQYIGDLRPCFDRTFGHGTDTNGKIMDMHQSLTNTI